MKHPCPIRLAVALCGLLVHATVCFGQGTAFTYQGRLNDTSSPANGTYNLRFGLFDAATGTNQLGSLQTNSAVGITNGIFTVSLDFGSQFSGAPRWLEIGVATNGTPGFTTLSPRQQITAAPYSIYSIGAASAASASSVAAANISGTLTQGQLPASVIVNGQSGVNLSGTFSGTFGSPNFTVNQLINHAGPLNLTGFFTAHGGTLLVTVSGSGYANTSPGQIGAFVLFDNVSMGSISVTANNTFTHLSFVSKQFVFTGVPPGFHAIGLNNLNLNTTTDSGDSFCITLMELPF